MRIDPDWRDGLRPVRVSRFRNMDDTEVIPPVALRRVGSKFPWSTLNHSESTDFQCADYHLFLRSSSEVRLLAPSTSLTQLASRPCTECPPCAFSNRSRAVCSGRRPLDGGLPTAALGLALHFCIALSAAAIFYLASRKIPALTRHPVVAGLFYGFLIYAVMNLVVLPLSAYPQKSVLPSARSRDGPSRPHVLHRAANFAGSASHPALRGLIGQDATTAL